MSSQTVRVPADPLPDTVETFRLALPPAELRVRSTVPGLRTAVGALVEPLFEMDDATSLAAPCMTFTTRSDAPSRTIRTDTACRPAQQDPGSAPHLLLHPDGPRYVILERTLDRSVLLRDGETDSAPLLITVPAGGGRLTVEAADAGPASVRAVVRLLGTLLGAQLTGRGAVFLHGSAVAVNGSAVLMLGPKHQGKSSLAFLAVTRCGADYVSDDTLVAWAHGPGSPPVLRGWPKRVGIATALLADHPARDAFERAPLRRHGSGRPPIPVPSGAVWSTGPQGRKRIFADLDEFTALTGATVATGSRPAGIVLPRADPSRRGWAIEPVADRAEALAEALLAGADLRHFTDYLGLLPHPRPEPAVRSEVLAALAALPCVSVAYGPDVNVDFPRFWDEVTAAFTLSPDREA
ncbi:hypothetical protein AGRA3207_007230 [Actinomadura graeca]|uniref:Uncharacterized protein n=1 Tax=Actinomadura graeca TaxID=2750812 RepID=A0ABX8R6X7_9ACTN|nr:hypothetical protein [Actinomadura graeca]QXJ25702.1 hypothetical protein AGRA3207_007230 [Actinomadura graeca]